MATLQQVEAVKRALIIAVHGGDDVLVGFDNGYNAFVTHARILEAAKEGGGVADVVRVVDGVLQLRCHKTWDWMPVPESVLPLLANRLRAFGWQ
jgi:hypothetical protein